jgi:hypothetical protein
VVSNSSNSVTARTLAESDLLRALRELANLQDNAEAFERFCKRWPELAYVSDDAPELHPIEETGLPTKFWLLYERRAYLQDLWEGDAMPLRRFLLPDEPPEELREKYVDFVWGHGAQILLDWRRGEIVYAPKTPFQWAIYTLFRKSALARVCANPDCPARYFIATKGTQRYCSDKCAEVFQKAWKRKWWAEHGDAWRRGRKKTKRNSGGKRG